MAGTTVKVEGLRDLDAALRDLGKSLGKAVLRRTLKKAAEPFDASWRGMAPDDPATGGADLKKSGGIGTKLSKRQAGVHRKMFRDDRASVEMFAGPYEPVAHLLEFGTVERFHKSGKSVGLITPRPFVRPAWDRNKSAMPKEIARLLWIEIEKAAKRKAKREAKLAAKG